MRWWKAKGARSAELAIIIWYPTSSSGAIVILKTHTKYREFFPTLFVTTTDFQLVFNFKQMRTVTIFGEHGIMAPTLWCLDLHYPMIQFLIINNHSMRFCDIRNNQGWGKCYQPSRRPRLITLTETLIIPDITKTESKSCFMIHYFE